MAIRVRSVGNGVVDVDIIPATGAAGGPALKAFIDRLQASITVALARENTTSARIALICDKKPEGAVRVRLRSSDPAIATIAPEEVLFTPETWRVTQFVEVQRVAAGSSPAPVTIRTSQAFSNDLEFRGLPVPDVTLDFAPGSTNTVPESSRSRVPSSTSGELPTVRR